jgi:hypothetical protein
VSKQLPTPLSFILLYSDLGVIMDSKIYIEWGAREKKWCVKNCGQTLARFDTKEEAKSWVRRNYPGEGFEEERVVVREDSPRGAKRGQWMK